MSTTPATPFLLTKWSRFTPTFQTDNGDASLGADGVAAGAWFIVGHTLVMEVDWFVVGAGASPGTGNLLIPFPPGYTSADVDVLSMPRVEDEESTIEGSLIAPCIATLDANKSPRWCVATVAWDTSTTPPTVTASELELDGLATVTDGDSLHLRIELPLIERALP